MSEFLSTPLPVVLVFCPDEACRRRALDFFRREFAGGAFGIFDESRRASLPDRPRVELRFFDPTQTRYWAVNSDHAFVFPLETTCSDETLRATSFMLAEVSRLRNLLTDARRSEGALQRLAAADALTSLANRRAWDEALIESSRTAAQRGESLTVALFDLDEFKRVNDAHGHAVGDAVLRATADGLRDAIRRDDLAARLGGDEFGLLLPGVGGDSAAIVVERIRAAVVTAIAAAGLPTITGSVGYVVGQGSELDAERLYAAAAAALQRAKQGGRNRSARG